MDIGYDTFIYSVYNALGVGPKNAVTRRELCARLRCGDRLLRQAIEDLRHDRVILTDDNGTGYYIPTYNKEGRAQAARWIARQKKRVKSINRRFAAQRRLSSAAPRYAARQICLTTEDWRMEKKPRDRIVRESMVFYRGWAEGIEDLDEKDQLEAFWNLIRYGLDGTEPTNKGPARSVFRLAKPQIDANNAKYQNSLKGGRRSSQMQPGDNQTGTKKEPRGNQTETKAET